MSGNINNLPASVKQRLHNYAVSRGDDFNIVQIRYATERLLYRLSISRHKDVFLLKGAMLFVLWENHPHRPTRDMDLLFLREHDIRELEIIFNEVISIEANPDGLIFDSDSLRVAQIREENAYGGIRVKLFAYLGSARIPVQVDVGMGDTVHPKPQWDEFNTILDFPAPCVRTYPIYTVVAEKFQAMVERGDGNSRMKDYFDIHHLLRKFSFSGNDLREAIEQTFRRRRTSIPDNLPIGLSPEFSENPQKQMQWNAFLRKNGLTISQDFEGVISAIADFLMPVITNPEIRKCQWDPDMGWRSE